LALARAIIERVSDWHALAAGATAAAPSFVVWKEGGDLDALAAERDWPLVEAAVDRWAAARGCRAVVRCTHVPGRLVLVAVLRGELLQIDLLAHRPSGVGSWFDVESVAAAAFVDDNSVRRLAPGCAALLRALDNPRDVEAREHLDAEAQALAERLPRPLVLRVAGGSTAARRLGAIWPTRARSWRRYRPCVVTRALALGRREEPGWLDAVRATHEVHDVG
jgi:hypothetical protein